MSTKFVNDKMKRSFNPIVLASFGAWGFGVCYNLAVAWFTAGVITPFFLGQENIIRSIILAIAGIFMSITFLALALLLLRKIKI